MIDKPIRIASRQSPLAVAQSRLVRDLLGEAAGVAPEDREEAFPILTYVTTGDRALNPTLAEIGGKGLFTKEIEMALLNGDADLAVHSMKDMPAQMPPGLILAATPPREDFRDAFVTLDGKALEDMPSGAVIGTSSVRRRAQLLRRRPDLQIVPFRGNVGTRLQKLASGEAEGTLLACAGLNRLGDDKVRRMPVSPDDMLPAPGQGTLCIQGRIGDEVTLALAAKINCAKTALVTAAEQALLSRLDGSCRTPIAGLATLAEDGSVTLRAEILPPDGSAHFAGARQFTAKPDALDASLGAAAAAGMSLADDLADEAGPDVIALFQK